MVRWKAKRKKSIFSTNYDTCNYGQDYFQVGKMMDSLVITRFLSKLILFFHTQCSLRTFLCNKPTTTFLLDELVRFYERWIIDRCDDDIRV